MRSRRRIGATSDRCDQCGRKIRFVATKTVELPGVELCSGVCLDRYRRDASIYSALCAGETLAELGARFDLRREKVSQICEAHRAREQRTALRGPPCDRCGDPGGGGYESTCQTTWCRAFRAGYQKGGDDLENIINSST